MLHAADPRLISAVTRITSALRLSAILCGPSAALLALAVRAFASRVIASGVTVAHEDHRKARKGRRAGQGQWALVPTHVIRALDALGPAVRSVGAVVGRPRQIHGAAAGAREPAGQAGVEQPSALATVKSEPGQGRVAYS